MRRLAIGISALMIFSTAAFAAGGNSIATAPLVPPGEPQFGNTSLMPRQVAFYNEYWKLPLSSGDRVAIDWQGSSREIQLSVLPFGTTDFTFKTTMKPHAHSELGVNNKAQLGFAATASGEWTLRFYVFQCCTTSRTGGPYDFVARVKQASRLFIPISTTVGRTGVLKVQVRRLDGKPITASDLRVTLIGTWAKRAHKLGVASPANGIASFKLRLPEELKGTTIRLRAVTSGEAWLTTGASRRVRVR